MKDCRRANKTGETESLRVKHFKRRLFPVSVRPDKNAARLTAVCTESGDPGAAFFRLPSPRRETTRDLARMQMIAATSMPFRRGTGRTGGSYRKAGGWRLGRVRRGFGRRKVKAAKGPRKRQEIKVWRAAQPLAVGAIEATRPHTVQPCTNTDQRQRVRAPFADRDQENGRDIETENARAREREGDGILPNPWSPCSVTSGKVASVIITVAVIGERRALCSSRSLENLGVV